MKTFKRNLLKSALEAGFAVAAIGLASAAMADPISYLPGGTDLSIKFVNREVAVNVGNELFGLLNITQFNNSDSSVTFWNGNGVTDGKQLVGYFEHLTAVADQTGGGGLSFTGGNGALYLVNNGFYQPGTTPNTKNYANQLCGGACPAAWLTFDFVPGINDSIPANASIQAAVATTNVQAGFGYMSVTGGTNMAKFDTNGFTFLNYGPADMSFRSNFVLANNLSFSTCTSTTGNGWQVCSDDPLSAKTVPEPATLGLLGLGLLGMAASLRKRKAV